MQSANTYSVRGAHLTLAILLWTSSVCWAQIPLQPSGTLYAVSNGTLTVYTTYSTWTGFWSTSITLAPGKPRLLSATVQTSTCLRTDACACLQASLLPMAAGCSGHPSKPSLSLWARLTLPPWSAYVRH